MFNPWRSILVEKAAESHKRHFSDDVAQSVATWWNSGIEDMRAPDSQKMPTAQKGHYWS